MSSTVAISVGLATFLQKFLAEKAMRSCTLLLKICSNTSLPLRFVFTMIADEKVDIVT